LIKISTSFAATGEDSSDFGMGIPSGDLVDVLVPGSYDR